MCHCLPHDDAFYTGLLRLQLSLCLITISWV